MKSKEWVIGGKKFAGKVTKQSGGEGSQLGGFDGRDRVIAQPNGVNRTPDIIASPGPHLPAPNQWKRVKPNNYVLNSGPNFRSPADLPAVGWKRKGYKTELKG